MAPDNRIAIREDGQYHYGVFDGEKWLATFQFFKDASEFAAKQTIARTENPVCEYCERRHDTRLACPEYIRRRAITIG